MASDYGRNFGFRRSDESVAIREGRYKTPADGAPLRIGTAVEIDPDEPGFLKQSEAGTTPISGFHGLLVQEESHLGSIFEGAPLLGHDSLDLGVAKLDQLSTIWGGNGTKVWMKNTPAYSRGSRQKPAVQIFDPAGLAVGDRLGWDGTKWVKSNGESQPNWLVVTVIDSAAQYCEAVITF